MRTALIGAGTMGAGIAQVAATAGEQVWLHDQNPVVLESALAKIQSSLEARVAKGKMSSGEASQILGRVSLSEKLDAIPDCGLVIDAIVEQPGPKSELFRKLSDRVSDSCLLASNTSSLSITSLAASCRIPERFIGIHFFNPAPAMQLVEIIPAVQTSPETLKTALDILQKWNKTTVVAKDTPGFIVNRVARPFYGEALRIFEEGTADRKTIDWAMKTLGGFPMGPFELMDFIGNDINYTVTETVFHAFFGDPRYMPSFTQKRLVEAGFLGRKTGIGHFDYTPGSFQPVPTEDPVLGGKIRDRIVAMLINEAADALRFGIATRDDIDTAMTKGVNYPKGLLAWADETGIRNVVSQLDSLFDEFHDTRYRCSGLLRQMARDGKTFYPAQ